MNGDRSARLAEAFVDMVSVILWTKEEDEWSTDDYWRIDLIAANMKPADYLN